MQVFLVLQLNSFYFYKANRNASLSFQIVSSYDIFILFLVRIAKSLSIAHLFKELAFVYIDFLYCCCCILFHSYLISSFKISFLLIVFYLVLPFKMFSIFLFIWETERVSKKGRAEGQKQSSLSTEPNKGLNPTTQRSWLGPKQRIGHPTNWATRKPLICFSFCHFLRW